MPWEERDRMSLRKEFAERASCEGANISALCREYGISRECGYNWLDRAEAGGEDAFCDRSRRPHHSPNRTEAAVEQAVLAVRDAHPTWGARKIRAYLLQQQGEREWPVPSTINTILKRHGRIDSAKAVKHQPYQSFVMERPNQLWQMDFKGHFRLDDDTYCHPLVVLDDHSRFVLGLVACSNERYWTVRQALTTIFREYGLPERMLMDNGSPWGSDRQHPYTIFTTWLMQLEVDISHGREYHPQTQGKVERFNRTLGEELTNQRGFADLAECQKAFDEWLPVYNLERPHEALDLFPPATQYQASSRPFPEDLPPVSYDSSYEVRKVDDSGKISFRGHSYRMGKAFRHESVGIQPSGEGTYDVYYGKKRIASLDVRPGKR